MAIATTHKKMGKVTTTITVTNWVDEVLAERGFIEPEQVRSVTLEKVLVDTGASRLCLPKDVIDCLGLKCSGENDIKTPIGVRKARLFDGIKLTVQGRTGQYNCIELPEGSAPLLGLIPLEDLGLEPDLQFWF
jgi:predicted aspartyl protease